jgi:DNA-binding MarR family transcriptional regulator/GNAT superfamily N-acetyltransferase
MDSDAIDAIRAFSRGFAARFGMVGRSYLGSGLGLTEARVLHDIGHPLPGTDATGPRARDLARALDLDEGQLSRILARLARDGLIDRAARPDDRRTQALRLTPDGRARLAALEDAARARVRAGLDALPPATAAALANAARHLSPHLGDAPPGITLRDLAPGDAGWIVERHAALYARDEGYDATFEALVAEILAAFLRAHDPARERGWIAEGGAMRLGSIFCMREDDDTARLRLFFLERAARGQGLGRRMLDTCLAFATDAGYRRLTLWTHESHRAARALYAARGFTLTDSRPACSFGQTVVEETWSIPLA